MLVDFIADLARGLCAVPAGGGTDLRSAMLVENERWLSAFNRQEVEGVRAAYTPDAILIPPGAPVANGQEEIGNFWQARMDSGVRDHTFEIVSAFSDGNYAYQVTKWTAVLVKTETKAQTPLSGSNLRVFERQGDGSWKVKAHVFVRD